MDDATNPVDVQNNPSYFKRKFAGLAAWIAGRPRSLIVVAGVAVLGLAFTTFSFASTPPNTNIAIDPSNPGGAFMGIGAVAGATTRLLVDYPEPQRSQILDYLFKPDYGASLQILKMDIGGDAAATNGAVPAAEHTPGQFDCTGDYQWWLAAQARARNPNIKIYGLQWAAPGWVSSSTGTLWTNRDADYVVDWLNCGKAHGITVNYLGGWNEHSYNATWFETLRADLNANGYKSVQLVAADQPNAGAYNGGQWSVATALASDPTFNSAVSIIGGHDSCGSPTDGYLCQVTPTAESLNKPVWESEIGAMDANTGGADFVRAINNGYIQADISAYIQWPIMEATTEAVTDNDRGFVSAQQPWSGYYKVDQMTWATAQTTQFTAPGWLHVNGANRKISTSGTYNTYESPDHSQWSLVAENTGTSATQTVVPQQITVTVAGATKNNVVHVWSSNLSSSDPTQWFVQQTDITPSNGVFTYTIPAGYVVTFTTSSGQTKGTAAPINSSSAMPLPYVASPDTSSDVTDLGAQDGSFEYVPCLGGVTGNCIQQMAPQLPVERDTDTHLPNAIVGDTTWSNYTASSSVLLPTTTSNAGVIGRYNHGGGDYAFDLSANGTWHLYENYPSDTPTTLKTGSVTGIHTNTWHVVSLNFNGSTITASIDGKVVATITNTTYTSGLAGLESNWANVQYNNFTVTP